MHTRTLLQHTGLALLFFVLLLFQLLPFCYMSFYVSDRRFFAADVASELYHPSAYYAAAVISGASCAACCSLSRRRRVRACERARALRS